VRIDFQTPRCKKAHDISKGVNLNIQAPKFLLKFNILTTICPLQPFSYKCAKGCVYKVKGTKGLCIQGKGFRSVQFLEFSKGRVERRVQGEL